MAPHSNTASAYQVATRRSHRKRSGSVSSESSAYSSGSDSAASGMSLEDVIRQTRSRSDSVSSDSSIASTVSLYSHANPEAQPSITGKNATTAASETPKVAGGVKKRTKRPRLTHPKVKREYKPRKDVLEKALREELKTNTFPLADLEWSNWKRAMQRKNPQTSKWEPRFEGHTGVRSRKLFSDMNQPAVYEVAVKVPDQKQKIPVLASVKQGIQGQSWEAALLSKDKLRSQVDRVLRRNCKLYVRRAPFSVRDMPSIYRKCDIKRKAGCARSTDDAVHELRGLMARVCDYAWRDHYDIPSRTYSHRGLVVKGVKVSD